MKNSYYCAVMVGGAPVGMAIELEHPIESASDVLTLADKIREKLASDTPRRTCQAVVIINLVPFGECTPANQI